MKDFYILYGFKSELSEQGIAKAIKGYGLNAIGNTRYTKEAIKEYVDKNPRLDAVIIKEYLDGGGQYTAKDLRELSDDSNVNIVFVLGTKHKGREFSKEIYNCGILSAYYTDGRVGASAEKLAELAVKGRTRRQARDYYKIDEKGPNHDILTYEDFRDNYRFLLEKAAGFNIADRFISISHRLTPPQMKQFIDGLPDGAIALLERYEEYYDILYKLKRLGYVRQVPKAPAGVKKGVPKEAYIKKFESEKNEDSTIELQPVRNVRYSEEAAAPRKTTLLEENAYEEERLDLDNPDRTALGVDEDIHTYAKANDRKRKANEEKLSLREQKKLEKEKAKREKERLKKEKKLEKLDRKKDKSKKVKEKAIDRASITEDFGEEEEMISNINFNDGFADIGNADDEYFADGYPTEEQNHMENDQEIEDSNEESPESEYIEDVEQNEQEDITSRESNYRYEMHHATKDSVLEDLLSTDEIDVGEMSLEELMDKLN